MPRQSNGLLKLQAHFAFLTIPSRQYVQFVEAASDNEFLIAPLQIRNPQEYQELQRLRREAFTPWLDSHPPRLLFNIASQIFDGFLLEARLVSGAVVGYVFSAPAFWSGDPGELHTYDYHRRSLYRRPLTKTALAICSRRLPGLERQLRQAHLRGSNCIVLLAMLVEPDYRGRRIPMRFIEHLKQVAAANGYGSLIAPFRPSGYGEYKKQTRTVHSEELFREYCYAKGADGLPIDPWLRVLSQNGMKMLRPEPRSMQVTRDMRAFETLRKTYRPEQWYRTSDHTWECGQASTWYTNPYTQTTTSVEPNVWGMIPV